MALLAVLALGASWWLVSALATARNRTSLELAQNARVLAEAKQAVLGWVVEQAMTDNYPGRLPCPEPSAHVGTANEGVAAPYAATGTTCSVAAGTVGIGRLPWKTLGTDMLRDAVGEPLWYAVTVGSTGWALQTSATVLSINSNKTGGLTFDGGTVVAVIIAPGRPLNINPTAAQAAAGCTARTQSRSATPPDYRDYVECHNLAGNAFVRTVVSNATQRVFNDQLVTITAQEVVTAIENIIHKRIRASVVPQLQAVAYTGAEWGLTALTPVFPYMARFQNAGTFNPDTYQGNVGTSQGLLPVHAQTCNSLTTGRCDTNFNTASAFVQWTTASITAVQTAGTATTFTADCTSSTVLLVRCTINYSQVLCLLTCGINSTFRVRADARYVGRTFKTLNTAGASATPNATAYTSGLSLSAALQNDANASARVTYTGTFNGGSATGICGFLIALLCSGSGTVTIPIAVFQDHAFLNPTSADSWYWFMANKWYEVSYFSVAASHLPSGATHNCTSAGDCIALASAAAPNVASNISSMVVFAGRSLTNTSRPNSTLSDFLEDVSGYASPAPNRDGDRNFAEGTYARKTYNDRFYTLTNY